MTINQLKYVMMVSKSSSMREAAGKLYLSQPALTAAIRELEEELGIILFERTNKGTTLTEEGREFLTFTKQVVSHYEVMEDRYLSRDPNKEHFSVSSQHYNFAVDAFASLVRSYHPDQYVFSFHETRTNEVLANVRDLKSEIGILSYSNENQNVIHKLIKGGRLEFVPLMKRNTYAYVWKDHPLAGLKEISLDQLAGYPCISFSQGGEDDFSLREEALGNYDFPKIIKSDDRATSMELIAQLQGFSIGTGMLAGETQVLQGLVPIKLKEEDPLTIGYLYRKDSKLSELGECYVSELKRYREIESAN